MHASKRDLKNTQRKTARTFNWITIIFIIVAVAPLEENNPLSGIFALTLLGIFLSISSVVIAYIFGKRAKKMDELINGSQLIAEWELDREMKKAYVQEMKRKQKEKNKALIYVIGGFFLLFTIIFMFVMEEDRGFFLLLMGSIFLLIFSASKFFPWYYKQKNLKGDGLILLGTKFAYINGYFHNWDFPLSGLTKVKKIKKPFAGIRMVYYYTDRTFTNTHELTLPATPEVDLDEIIFELKSAN